VVASHNAGKVREIAALLEPLGLEVVSAGELNLAEPEETGTSFQENAALKAEAAAEAARLPALADDSGLCVDALHARPGIYSARWGGPDKDFSLAMRRLERELNAAGAHLPEERTAHFVCALAFARPASGGTLIVQGYVHGRIVHPPRGRYGFGYDPVFIPEGWAKTFGEVPYAVKEPVSHRADAFAKLLKTWGMG
jgi:XTP/dITP diphosphohydrolase